MFIQAHCLHTGCSLRQEVGKAFQGGASVCSSSRSVPSADVSRLLDWTCMTFSSGPAIMPMKKTVGCRYHSMDVGHWQHTEGASAACLC